MVRFSLIVATIDRTHELSVLLDSLVLQEFQNFEVIVVDQNQDERVSELLAEWRKSPHSGVSNFSMPIRLLRCGTGVSRARNFGLSHSVGSVVAFPDDDCWYPPTLLKNVAAWLDTHEDYGILSVGCKDERGRTSSNRWWQKECDISWINIFRTSGTCCFFVRRPSNGAPLLFDEALGPGAGTDFGCGEDSDFLMMLMKQGIRGRFDSSIDVGHPCKNGFVDAQRAARYGGGFGGVLAKHKNPLLCAALVVFDFSRAAFNAMLGDRSKARRLWIHGVSMAKAYFTMLFIQRRVLVGSKHPR